MSAHSTPDVVIIGGGVIGLSLAYELAGRDLRVHLVDRGPLGREASWAGAGIIPPGAWYHDHPAMQALATVSGRLYPLWSEALREATGIDNGWRVSGGLYLDSDPATADRLERWSEVDITVEKLDTDRLRAVEPALATSASQTSGYFVPGEAQIRNPRHLQALIHACAQRGVVLQSHTTVVDFIASQGRVDSVVTNAGRIAAANVCLAAGCWTGPLAAKLNARAAVKPIRGQMVLLRGEVPTLERIVHDESRYLVPRDDGRVLVGSTVEDVGFHAATTVAGIRSLLDFAERLVPAVGQLTVERTWAGLRPATETGLPWIGRLPTFENAWIAAGHHRAGLQLAPATAVVVGALMRGEAPPVDVASLGVE